MLKSLFRISDVVVWLNICEGLDLSLKILPRLHSGVKNFSRDPFSVSLHRTFHG